MKVRGGLWVLTLSLVGTSCTALADVDVKYEECVRPAESPYVEGFESSYQDLLDRCWKVDQAGGAKIFTGDGDLILRPSRSLSWSATTQAPMLHRRMTGDFLVVTRAEPASTIGADHCFKHEAAAGLVVLRRAPLSWITLLVHPWFDPNVPLEQACKDESARPPAARVEATSLGFGAPRKKDVTNVGYDAEAYIAMCRQGDRLAHYYRLQDPKPKQVAWILIEQLEVDREPLDIGLTTSEAQFAGDDPAMEGHFPWVVFADYSTTPVPDGCEGALVNFKVPEVE